MDSKEGTDEGGLSIDLGKRGRVRQIPLSKHFGHDTGNL